MRLAANLSRCLAALVVPLGFVAPSRVWRSGGRPTPLLRSAGRALVRGKYEDNQRQHGFQLAGNPGPADAHQSAVFCRVVGVSKPSSDSNINFEVWLPSTNWNGKFVSSGEGGFAGR